LFEKVKNEENKNSNFEEMLRRFENILSNEDKNLKNKITNHFEKTLKSNATTKRQIEHAKSVKKVSHNDFY
jgi:succinate dehydrogenase flavin-adding protein (antitoxin of CptAB toxin-antitoxin module)